MISRALIAAQPAALKRLKPMLESFVDTVAVHTPKEAFRALERNGIDLIICTIAFDDSRMIEFLQAVKQVPGGRIPFVCCRALLGVLSDHLVESTRTVAVQCGAIALVDIAKLNDEKAQSALKAAVTACLPRK
jgi:CheY-like chemotaxis protein